jgi:signal transduction histidine kinase
MSARVAGGIGLAGIGTAAATSAALGMPAGEALELAAIAAGAAGAAAIVGAIAVRLARRRSLATQSALVASTAVLAAGVGAWVAAAAMFIEPHDLHALVVVLIAAATAGVVIALVLAGGFSRATRALGDATRRIAEGDLSTVEVPAPGELAELATRLGEMTQKLDESRERERATDASRRELVAWVSHDLRTPLAGIRAMAEALEDGVAGDAETVARYHRMIRFETERLSRLVDDLFELSRIHAGALRLQMERVSLDEIVSDALSAADALARSKGVHLAGRVNGSSPTLYVSASEFQRMLRNLISNAIRHTPSDGTVFVEAGASDGQAYVSVADGCGGISDDDLPRVFDVSFRGEQARTPSPDGGAGLGLAVARGLAEAHHGEIDVANAGAGCRFTVRVPLEPEVAPA